MLTFTAGVIVGATAYRYLGKTNPILLDYIVTRANAVADKIKAKFKK